MTAFTESITLIGRHAALEPLAYEHEEALAEAVRDTVVFSIVAHEWPAVKRHLEFKLAGN